MRLVTFEVRTPFGPVPRTGALRRDDEEIVDLVAASSYLLGPSFGSEVNQVALPADMLELLALGHAGLERAREVTEAIQDGPLDHGGVQLVYRRDAVRVLSPVPRPRSIREYSEWVEHGSMMRAKMSTPPVSSRRSYMSPANAYNGNPMSVSGPDDDIIWPDYSDVFDLEPELGVFVGSAGSNLTREEAKSYIAGYSLFIDNSARDNQRREPGQIYKGKDFHNIIGPCIVTPDEFDEWNGQAWISVNGEKWWEYEIGRLRKFSAADLIAFASDTETLYPGDFFGLGTIGTGAQIDLDRWVKPGDVFEFGIEGLGVLRHKVVRLPGVNWVRTGLPGNSPVPADESLRVKI